MAEKKTKDKIEETPLQKTNDPAELQDAAPAEAVTSAWAVSSASGLNLRISPNVNAPIATCLPDGTYLTELIFPVEIDAPDWAFVLAELDGDVLAGPDGNVLTGWVMRKYLIPLEG